MPGGPLPAFLLTFLSELLICSTLGACCTAPLCPQCLNSVFNMWGFCGLSGKPGRCFFICVPTLLLLHMKAVYFGSPDSRDCNLVLRAEWVILCKGSIGGVFL